MGIESAGGAQSKVGGRRIVSALRAQKKSLTATAALWYDNGWGWGDGEGWGVQTPVQQQLHSPDHSGSWIHP